MGARTEEQQDATDSSRVLYTSWRQRPDAAADAEGRSSTDESQDRMRTEGGYEGEGTQGSGIVHASCLSSAQCSLQWAASLLTVRRGTVGKRGGGRGRGGKAKEDGCEREGGDLRIIVS